MAHLGRCFRYSSTPSLCCKTVNRVTHVAYYVAIMLNTANVMASFNVRLGYVVHSSNFTNLTILLASTLHKISASSHPLQKISSLLQSQTRDKNTSSILDTREKLIYQPTLMGAYSNLPHSVLPHEVKTGTVRDASTIAL